MTLADRKPAQRRDDIPADVLQALSEGRIESISLAEWYAIDYRVLLQTVLPQVGLAEDVEKADALYKKFADEKGITRIKSVGRLLHGLTKNRPDRDEILDKLAAHTSDAVRAWAAWMIAADDDLSLDKRLETAKRFATDRAISVRENAWDSFRRHVIADLDRGLQLLEPWVHDEDKNIRRCAVEGTRPRGVTTVHIVALKKDPELALRLIEPVRSDPSRYVQNAVANWLNDASKDAPEWVVDLTDQWSEESPTKETSYIVNRALRTLRKKGRA
jgi:3-methyladenine DNA glycosylase AlkC